MKKLRRILAFVLALAMVLALAACGGKENAETKAPDESKKESTAPTKKQDETKGSEAAPTEPAEPIKITIGLAKNTRVVDYETNAYTLWLEEATGYEIEVIPFDSSEYQTQLNTMIASNTRLPDVLFDWRSLDANIAQTELGEDGILIDCQPYLDDEEFMSKFDLKERLADRSLFTAEEERIFWSKGLNEDGTRYGVPSMLVESTDLPRSMTYINKAWLDKLNMDIPKTMDEFVTYLRAVKAQDMNGNGDTADEIPFLGATKLSTADNISWLINNWCFFNDKYPFQVDVDGKVYLAQLTDEYRTALIEISKMYAEALISSMCYSISSWPELRGVICRSDSVSLVGAFSGHSDLAFADSSLILDEYVALPPFNYAPLNGPSAHCYNLITTDCENPEAAMPVILTMLSEEGGIRAFHGEYGTDWVYGIDAQDGHEGTKILNPNVHVDMTLNHTWGSNNCSLLTINSSSRQRVIIEEKENLDWASRSLQLLNSHTEKYFAVAEKNNPSHTYQGGSISTPDESEELSLYWTDMNNYIKNMRSQFITGESDPSNDAQWAAYLTEIQRMHVDRVLEIRQAEYDRYCGMTLN